jgi:hypothetical protein
MLITYAKLVAAHTLACRAGGLPVATAAFETPSVGGVKLSGMGNVTCAHVSVTVAHSPDTCTHTTNVDQ